VRSYKHSSIRCDLSGTLCGDKLYPEYFSKNDKIFGTNENLRENRTKFVDSNLDPDLGKIENGDSICNNVTLLSYFYSLLPETRLNGDNVVLRKYERVHVLPPKLR